jgi:hypothetical protein
VALFQINCPDCHESHILWRGRMAVHTTGAGIRCDGTVNAPKPPQPKPQGERTEPPFRQTLAEQPKDSERQASYSLAAKGRKGRRPAEPLDIPVPRAFGKTIKPRVKDPNRVILPIPEASERRPLSPKAQESFEKAMQNIDRAVQKDRERRADPLFGMHRESTPIDRRIYQVKGAHPVSGGSPSLGKGH